MPRKPQVRPQITQMSPISPEELNNAPTDTNVATSGTVETISAPSTDSRPRGEHGRLLRKDGTERAQKQYRNRGSSATPSNMDDPRYRKAIEGMSFFGAPRVIKRGFSSVATITKDESFKLDAEEEGYVEDYFYAVSKHSNFDPMGSLIGRILLFVLLLGELVLPRMLKRSNFAKRIKELIERNQPETEEKSE